MGRRYECYNKFKSRSFEAFHDSTQAYLNNVVGDYGYSFLEPGTQEFQDAFNEITSQTRYDENGNYLGGTKFYDKSQLYHLQTEYKFNIGKKLDLQLEQMEEFTIQTLEEVFLMMDMLPIITIAIFMMKTALL